MEPKQLKTNSLQLKVVDARHALFTDEDAKAVLAEVGSRQYWQVQVRCDSIALANRVRSKIYDHAMADGRQFEMTILGMGVAVGVKLVTPSKYVWDASRGASVPIEQWNREHPENPVRTN